MPRNKANPDPMVESYTRSTGKKLTYTIEATRIGGFRILLNDQVIETGGDPLSGFAGHRYSSNKRQAEAMEQAKRFIESRSDGDNW